MSWSALPIELTIRLLTFFDGTSLATFRRVNSFFKSLIDSDETTTFQYRIALSAAGMVDGPPGNLSASERLELLRRYEASWKNFEWSEHHTVHYSIGLVWAFYGNVWGHTKGSYAIDFVQLPSRLRGISLRQWTLQFDFEVRNFSMDPSQDLLVTIEDSFRRVPNLCRIRSHTLSTGDVHPLAGSITALEYTLDHHPEPTEWGSSIRICGDYVAIFFVEYHDVGRDELVVWNWRTGVQKLIVVSTNLRSFTFLDDNLILVSTSRPPTLLVYSLDQGPADDTKKASTPRLRFLFGSRYQGPSGTSNILVTSDPSPGCLPSTGKVPFQLAGDERVIVIYSQHFDHWGAQTFLVPAKVLLRTIKSIPTLKEGRDVDWELYGPGQRFIELVPGQSGWDDKWPYFVFGMRYISRGVVRFIADRPMVVIRDLSQRRFLRASEEERDESNVIYQAMSSAQSMPYTRSLLDCVPFLAGMDPYWNGRLLISEDGIAYIADANAVAGPGTLHLFTI